MDRVIAGLREAGVENITVVYGHSRVRDHLKGRGLRLVKNSNPELGPAHSLRLGLEGLEKGPFLLVMSDHLFDHRMLSRLMEDEPRRTTLCIDRDLDGRDLKEATKVLTEGRMIKAIGKGLSRFNALDTGVFYCTDDVREAALSNRDARSLSEVMGALAAEGRLEAFDATGTFWMDIDTAEDRALAEKRLAEELCKPGDGPVSRHLNRRLSKPLSQVMARLGATPNQISLLSFMAALASALSFAAGIPFWGGVMAQLSSILDGCDGEVARIRGLESRFGAYLDSLLDRYGDVAILLGMTATAPASLWLPGLLAILGSYSISYTASRAEYYTGGRFKGSLENMMNRDVRLFLIMVGGVLGQIGATLAVLALLTNMVVGLRLAAFRPMTSMGEAQKGL